jgi:AcrR family transcriptional regulator
MARAGAVRPGRVSLMRTAIGLMGEHGYEGTSTRDIASAAGVSVAALYYHFPSKLDLLREFLHEAHDVVLVRVARAVDGAGDDHRARLDAAVEALIWSNLHDAWARRASLVAWRELGRLAPADRRSVARKREAIVEQLDRVIRMGADAGAFETTEPGASARAILTLCVSVVDPFSEVRGSLARTIEVHQRLAAALADLEPPAKGSATKGAAARRAG